MSVLRIIGTVLVRLFAPWLRPQQSEPATYSVKAVWGATIRRPAPEAEPVPYEILLDDLERCHEERLRVLVENEKLQSVREVLAERVYQLEVRNVELVQELADWKREMARCDNCHYHRHIALGLEPAYLSMRNSDWCSRCRAAVDQLKEKEKPC